MGFVVDAVGGLFGAGGDMPGGRASYRPYDVTSTIGTVTGGDQGVNFQLAPELQNVYQGLLAQSQMPQDIGAQERFRFGDAQDYINMSRFNDQLTRSQLAFDDSARQFGMQQRGFEQLAGGYERRGRSLADESRAQRMIAETPESAYQWLQDVYRDEFRQQEASEESRLYNMGLLGTTTGALRSQASERGRQDALLRRATAEQQAAFDRSMGLLGASQSLGQMGLSARGQALGATQAQLGARQAQAGLLEPMLGAQEFQFNANQQLVNQDMQRRALEAQLQEQRFQQSRQQLASALGIAQQGTGLFGLSGELGSQDLAAQRINIAGADAAEQRQSDFFGSLAGAGITAGAKMFSDMRLKDNIKHVNGFVYTWDWNDEAKRIGADIYPPVGVLAQEIMQVFPDAVYQSTEGYLKVDYSKVV